MFIIYSGEVGVYLDNECQRCIATLNENKVFGETALDRDDKRGASIVALTNTKVLVLHKLYYKNIIMVSTDVKY